MSLFKHPDKVTLGEEFELIIKFTNPLDEKLNRCKLHIEGHGITRSHVINLK